MFIHRKQNKSGTKSVLVREKENGKIVYERSFGSAFEGTPQFDELLREAQSHIDEMCDNVVNLFNQSPEGYWDEPESPPGVPTKEEVRNVLSRVRNSDIRIVGPEKFLGYIYDKVGYGEIGSPLLRDLVMSRIIEPSSKLSTVDFMARYLGKHYTERQVYYFLDRLCPRKEKEASEKETGPESQTAAGSGDGSADVHSPSISGSGEATLGDGDWTGMLIDLDSLSDIKAGDKAKEEPPAVPKGLREMVEKITYNWTSRQVNGVKVVFYDTSTIYFESEEDEDRKPGWSKDGKHSNPQLLLGLLLTAEGNLLGWDLFEGNKYEGDTMIPILKGIIDKYKLEKLIVIADAGLLSKNNIKALEEDGMEYILGARVKSLDEATKGKILGMKLKNGDIRVLKLGKGMRMIVSKTEGREKKDEAVAKKGLARLEKRVKSGVLTKQHINNRGYNKYLKMEGEVTISIDRDKFKEDEKWYGIKGYTTNTHMGKSTVIGSYHNLWYIERAFRINKTDLLIRPIFHRLINRIEGHVCICFMAYTVIVEMERMIKRSASSISVGRVTERLKDMYAVGYHDPVTGESISIMLGLDDEQKEILRILENDIGGGHL